MLEITKVTKTFNARTVNERIALNEVSLHLNDRDFVTVIGGNGAGKIHAAERDRRRLAHRERKHRHRRH